MSKKNFATRKEILNAGLNKNLGGNEMEQQLNKTEQEIMQEVNEQLAQVAPEPKVEEPKTSEKAKEENKSSEKEDKKAEELKRLALVSPGENGITPDYFSSLVDFSYLMKRNLGGLDEIIVSGNSDMNVLLQTIIKNAATFGGRNVKRFKRNLKEFLENIKTGSALIEVKDKIVTFTSPDGTISETTIQLAFGKTIPKSGRSADFSIDNSDTIIDAIALAVGLKE